jgi:lipopolysaccharide/colanic/teichoic acid biosynthesis glycosyltransferase
MSDLIENAQPVVLSDGLVQPTQTRRVQGRSPIAPPSVLIFREDAAYHSLKRALDLVGALVAIVIAMPLLLCAGLAILLEDGWPFMFFQRRVGRRGRLFTIYKLRTMQKNDRADGFSPTSDRDPRITRVGHWLRRSSIDELPQLFNVLRGEMAFVGPRPEMPFIVREYEAWQHLRHLVTPGITGFWQIRCRSTVPLHFPEATMLDLDYIRQASYATDAAVLLKTVQRLISTEGAY